MASSLTLTKTLLSDLTYELLVSVTSGSSLPPDIFIALNTGTSEAGEHAGVCSLEEYQRFQTFTGTPIPKFGNKYVKVAQAKIIVTSESEIDSAIAAITSSVTSLSSAIRNSAQTTTVIDIP